MDNDFIDYWDNKWSKAICLNQTTFSQKVLNFLLEKKGKLIDLGAGSGRDSLFFLENNFSVTSFDFSKIAINKLKKTLKERELYIETILGNLKNYDFGIDKYDFIYACNSLHYFSWFDTIRIIEKLKKSINKNGYFFMRVKSINDFDYQKGEIIEFNYYRNGKDIKNYFNKEFIEAIFLDFEIISLEYIYENHDKIGGNSVKTGFIDLIAKKI